MRAERLLLAGILAGVMLSMVLLRRTIVTEVVRDKDGRIVQIVEMHQPRPLIGTWLYNTSSLIAQPAYEAIEVEGKRKRIERIIP